MASPKRVVPSKSKGGYNLFEWVPLRHETNLAASSARLSITR